MKPLGVSILIQADPDEVYKVATDYEHIEQVIPEITEIEFLTEKPVQVGTRFRETRLVSKKPHTEELSIAELDPNGRRAVLNCESMGSEFQLVLSVTPVDEGHSEASMAMHVKGKNLLASAMWFFIGPMTRRMMCKALLKDLEHIRDYVTGVACLDTSSTTD